MGREEVDPPGCWTDRGTCVGSGVLDPPGCCMNGGIYVGSGVMDPPGCMNEGIGVGNGKLYWKDEGTCVCWNGKPGGLTKDEAPDGLIKDGLPDENCRGV